MYKDIHKFRRTTNLYVKQAYPRDIAEDLAASQLYGYRNV